MSKILIIPDVHCRIFWKDAIKEKGNEVDKIIFLGDYLDPYPWEGFTFEDGLERLKEIINLKKNCPDKDKITLLWGNHCVQYLKFLGDDVFPCSRYNSRYAKEVEELFTENKNLFRLFYKFDKYVFSHAGIVKNWMTDYCRCDNLDDLLSDETKAYGKLWVISRIRGGNENYGSCVWNDVREFSNDFPEIYQIFGHTQLQEKPIIADTFACLDCRKAFILDTEINKFEEV